MRRLAAGLVAVLGAVLAVLLAGAWGLWSISAIWYYWLRAWVAGGVFGMLVALFWPAGRHATTLRASK